MMIENFWLNAAWSLLPTIVLGVIFYFVMRSVIRVDRNERRAYSELEAEERAKRGLPPKPPTTA